MPLHTIWLLAPLLVLGASRLPIAGATNAGSNIGLKLVAEGLNAPTVLVSIPDGSGRLLIADQSGVIHLLDRDGKKSEQPFLDLRGKMVALGKGMEERGLLGLALHPQFKSNRKFYVAYSTPLRANAPPQWDHTERLSEFKTAGDNFSAADFVSERVILEIDEPDWNHFADWSRSMAIPEGTLLVATIPPQSSGAARWTVQPLGLKEFPNGRIKSFFIWALGEDEDGELYVLVNGINCTITKYGWRNSRPTRRPGNTITIAPAKITPMRT